MPALLFESESRWFSLRVVAYQFEQAGRNEWDDNWLVVEISLRYDDLHWQTAAAALTAFELRELSEWARTTHLPSQLGFTEPCLSMELRKRGDETISRIILSHEFHPEGDLDGFGYDFRVTPTAMSQFVQGLEAECASFPERRA